MFFSNGLAGLLLLRPHLCLLHRCLQHILIADILPQWWSGEGKWQEALALALGDRNHGVGRRGSSGFARLLASENELAGSLPGLFLPGLLRLRN